MKNWGLLIGLFLGASITLSACSKGGDSSSGTVATTPCNSVAGGTCNTSFYNQATNLSIPVNQAYAYTYGGSYCGCPVGQRPVYNQSYGFACVPDSYITSTNYIGYNYTTLINNISYTNTFQEQNTYPLNTSQVYYQATTSNSGNACYSSFAMSCDVRVANSCGTAGFCQAVGGSTAVGVCVNNGYSSTSSAYYTGSYSTYYPSFYGYAGASVGGGYSSGGRCTYKQNSWGFWYSYCY